MSFCNALTSQLTVAKCGGIISIHPTDSSFKFRPISISGAFDHKLCPTGVAAGDSGDGPPASLSDRSRTGVAGVCRVVPVSLEVARLEVARGRLRRVRLTAGVALGGLKPLLEGQGVNSCSKLS